MKKVLVGLLLASAALFVVNGEDVFKTQCASCHAIQAGMTPTERSAMREKMQDATQEERVAMKQKMMDKMHKRDKKAPAMPMVSLRLKKMLNNDKA